MFVAKKIIGYKVDSRFPQFLNFDTFWAYPQLDSRVRSQYFLDPAVEQMPGEVFKLPGVIDWASPFGPNEGTILLVAKKGRPSIGHGFDLENWDILGTGTNRVCVLTSGLATLHWDLRERLRIAQEGAVRSKYTTRVIRELQELIASLETITPL